MDLNNKSILITGGTGSLGKALTKTILKKWPNISRLIIYSRDEQKQFVMARCRLCYPRCSHETRSHC